MKRGRKPGNYNLSLFWTHVDKDGPVVRDELGQCWLWTGTKFARGYGHAVVFGKNMGAHRASWILANGFLHPAVTVCHRCDNPPCVRPDHLFVGTMKDNMDDKMEKGRHDCGVGARNANARLTDEIVAAIREQIARGYSYRKIAAALGLHESTVSRAARGLSWAHVKDAARVASTVRSGRRSTLSVSDVEYCRAEFHSGRKTQRELGELFGLSISQMCRAINGKVKSF